MKRRSLRLLMIILIVVFVLRAADRSFHTEVSMTGEKIEVPISSTFLAAVLITTISKSSQNVRRSEFEF